jgi:Tfp pilus assembly protein PilF
LVLSWTGDPVGARSHYERAIELSPDYADAHFNFGMLLIDTGHPREAAEHLRVGVPSDPALVE